VSRRHNLRRLGKRRTYTANELAALLKINIGTVRRWCRLGLDPIDRSRPFLVLGDDVATFLAARATPRQPLAPGEFYCTPCRTRRLPRDLALSLIPRAATNVDFSGVCPDCGNPLFRRVRIAEIGEKLGPCRIAHEDDTAPMMRSGHPPQMPPSGKLTA
jgi:hypothetical protein